MNLNEKTLNSKMIFEGKIIDLRFDEVELPNGKKAAREIVLHPGAVAVVALTLDKEVLMVRQYRKAVETTLLEIPAGKIEQGEPIKECAQRELMEETGFCAGDLMYLTGIYTSPGFSNEIIHIFLAKNLSAKYSEPDDDEFIEVVKLGFEDAVGRALAGEFKDAKTLTGLLTAYHYLKGVL